MRVVVRKMKTFELTLESSTFLNDSVKHFAFRLPSELDFAFIPGQFIRLFIPNSENKKIARSYSLAQMSLDSGIIELAASYVKGGLATEHLFQMSAGDTIEGSGPFGRLILKPEETPKRLIFLSTNTGVTPFRAMLPVLKERFATESGLKVILLQGVRIPGDLLYGEDFKAFQSAFPDNFSFMPCYSRANPEANEPFAKNGYVQNQLEQIESHPNEDIFYLCGNPDMIDAAYNKLIDNGMTIKEIRREKYISP